MVMATYASFQESSDAEGKKRVPTVFNPVVSFIYDLRENTYYRRIQETAVKELI
jgi:hypothetical protein